MCASGAIGKLKEEEEEIFQMNTDQRFLHETLKMNSEFWLSRGPQNAVNSAASNGANNSFPQSLMDTSSTSDYHLHRSSEHSSSGANNGFHPTANAPNHNNNNNDNSSNNNTSSNNNADNLSDNNNRTTVDTKDRMLSGAENLENFDHHSPNEFQHQLGQQPNQPNNQDATSSPVAENLSSDLKFNADKFVNDIQVSL